MNAQPNLAAVIPPPALDGEIIGPGDDLRIVACPEPFNTRRIDRHTPAGVSLAELLEEIQPNPVLRRHAHISIGDHLVPPENWHRVRPKAGTTVYIRVVPSGGGGSSKILRILLTFAVLAAAIAAPYAIPGIAGVAAGALIAPGGRLLIARDRPL
jgi:hypothetical protein